MGYLSLRRFFKFINSLLFVFSFSNHDVSNKCGQTSRPVIRAQIQTSCNFEKSMYNRNRNFRMGLICASTYLWNPLITTWMTSVGLILCLITSIFCYTKIFISLCHSQVQVQDQVFQRQSSRNMYTARYRKAVFCALYIQVILVICYLPVGLAIALTPQREMSLSTYLARQFTSSFLLLNSSLNPLLYCWRLKEVRQAVKGTVKKLFCSQ